MKMNDESDTTDESETVDVVLDIRDWRRAYEVLILVYRDLRNKNSVSPETKSIISLFFEDYDGFIDIYEKEQRRKAGCSTYTDSKGKARYIDNNELF